MVCVLVVDDEATVLRNIARSLHQAGFDVLTATNCESAWLALNSSKIDALCLDIMLPDGNGLDLLEEVRRTAPDIPAIVISSMTTTETRLRAAGLGVEHFLPKPFSLASLKKVLAKTLVST
jgi:DNA-binding response OmpR family regulator